MPRYPRHIRPELESALADTPVTVVVGPRQSGKSTLAGEVAAGQGARDVSLDDTGPRAAANADPSGFIEQSELPLLIDEFQKAPALLEAIKSRVDRARRNQERTDGMFLLTGSANVWSTLKISESLAGRAERVQLWPLSQGEILGHREDFIDRLLVGRIPRITGAPTGRDAIARELVVGGYPEMLDRPEARRRARWVKNYIDMILERDVRDLAQKAQQLDELPRLLELAAARVANLFEMASMGKAIGMKGDSVSRYLKLLELMFLIRRAPAWSRNIGQRLIKAPKLWIPDSGLASELVGYSQERFINDETSLAGALFENFVAGEITKQATWCDKEVQLHHFRTAGGREVDIVLESKGGEVAGIEVKLAVAPTERDFSGLAHLRDKLGDRFTAGVVVHTGPETLPFGDRLWAVPVSALWS
jgi:uncharacterized protein